MTTAKLNNFFSKEELESMQTLQVHIDGQRLLCYLKWAELQVIGMHLLRKEEYLPKVCPAAYAIEALTKMAIDENLKIFE